MWPTHYELLGVPPDVSAEQLRRSYRELAKRLHPDLSGGLSVAEERFRTLAEAYTVLAEPAARGTYDSSLPPPARRWRRAVEGVVGSFFDALQATDDAPAPAPQPGEDHQVRLRLAFDVAILGGQRSVELPLIVPCGRCGGAAGLPEPSPLRCHVCGGAGTGREARLLGAPRRRACPLCRGTGALYPRLCHECQATGRVTERRTLSLTVPAATKSGAKLRVRGRGTPGRYGGPAGDLYVLVEVEGHPLLQRAGRDLHVEVPVGIGDAVDGAQVVVPTPEGSVDVALPSGTDMPHTVRVEGRGVPDGHAGRGDLCVRFFVEVPRGLTEAQRAAIRGIDRAGARSYPQRARFRRLTQDPGDER